MSSTFGGGREEDQTIGTIPCFRIPSNGDRIVFIGKQTITLSPDAPLVTPGTRLEFRLPKPREEYTDQERACVLNPPPSLQK
jgi:hypothetical protein